MNGDEENRLEYVVELLTLEQLEHGLEQHRLGCWLYGNDEKILCSDSITQAQFVEIVNAMIDLYKLRFYPDLD